MNERIQELYTQALENKFDYGGGRGVKPGEYYSNYKTVLNAEKFAELIVRECIKEIEFQYGGGNLMEDGITHNPEWNNAIECVSAMIKQHFGVKE
jgi:hypothetical protein